MFMSFSTMRVAALASLTGLASLAFACAAPAKEPVPTHANQLDSNDDVSSPALPRSPVRRPSSPPGTADAGSDAR